MKIISLTQCKVAVVDDRDYKRLSCFKWCAVRCSGRWYAARNVSWPDGPRRQRTMFMHRFILGLPDGQGVDHRNGDGLDNQRYNLRPATQLQNSRNRGPSSNNTTGFKGVVWAKIPQRYQVQLEVHGKKIWLGYFDDPVMAARAYDVKARQIHGEFARLNFP